MEYVIKAVFIGVLGAVFTLIFRNENKEIAAIIPVCTMMTMVFFGIRWMAELIAVLKDSTVNLNVSSVFVETALMLAIIALIGSIGSDVCEGLGGGVISKGILLITKIAMLSITIPILLQAINSFLSLY